MNTEKTNDYLECTYSVHAVIFGADESLLKLHLKDGFSFKRLSLNPSVDHLDVFFDTTAINLRRDYEAARIDNTSLDVICAVKERVYNQTIPAFEKQFEENANDDLVSLDNQIRVLRLLKEGAVRFKKIAFHQNCKYQLGECPISYSSNSIDPIGEAMITKPISKFHCEDSDIIGIDQELSRFQFPLSDSLLNSCHNYYDLSYHTIPCISLTLLITALELLFLERNAKSKRKILSKRCAVFLLDNNNHTIQETYRNILGLYDKRSNFVHDGTVSNITDSDIISLRAYVRDALLKALSLSESKMQRIERLKLAVENDHWLSQQ